MRPCIKMAQCRYHALKVRFVGKALSSAVYDHCLRTAEFDDARRMEFGLIRPLRDGDPEAEQQRHVVMDEMDCAARLGPKHQAIACNRVRHLRGPSRNTLKRPSQARVGFVSTGRKDDA